MEIKFAYNTSKDVKWTIEDFEQLCSEINNTLKLESENSNSITTCYVGIICLSEVFFEVLKPRKPKFYPSEKYMEIEVKIPLECKEWTDVRKFIIDNIVTGLDIAVKKTLLRDNGLKNYNY